MTQFNADLFDSLYPNIEPIAIIGAGCRYPGVKDPFSFWHKIADGEVLTRPITATDMEKAGFSTHFMEAEDFVLQGSILESAHNFDAEWFGYTPAETIALDPQQRLFLTCAWEALEMGGGLKSHGEKSRIGVFGAGRMSTYDHPNPNYAIEIGLARTFQYIMGNDKDYLATRVAYKLGLTGPALTVQTACSSSLVAAHMACEQLRNGECDLALVGGAALSFPMGVGYFYQPGTIVSPDGFCRPFDAKANGTFMGNGVAVVLLKPLRQALQEGDGVLAIIRGSAVNNDGGAKVGFTAPSSVGQQAVIREALALSDIGPEVIGFIEAHATATPLGDLIEVQALTEVFPDRPFGELKCALNSIKANTGHLDVAAGVSSLLTAAFAVKTGLIPPCANFHSPNPTLNLESTPFFVPHILSKWTSERRVAGVSSFGIGGTNAHMIVEALPEPLTPHPETPKYISFSLSARTEKDMRALARTHSQVLLDEDLSPDLGRYCATVNHARLSLDYHLHVNAKTRLELISQLKSFAQQGAEAKDLHTSSTPKTWYMGDVNYATQPLLPPRSKVIAPAPMLLGQNFASYDSTWPTLTASLREECCRQTALQDWTSCASDQDLARKLHTVYISNALDQLGIFATDHHATLDDVMSRGHVKKTYKQLVYRCLRDLVDSGALSRSHDIYSHLKPHALLEAESLLNTLKERGHIRLAEIIERCGPAFSSILQGEEDPVALVFPHGAMDHLEEIYKDKRNSQFLNALIAKAVHECVHTQKEGSPIRILEIGAGTGGTTSAILPTLSSDRISYTFSDIGPLFLEHAKTKFSAYPFLSFQRYDVDKDPEAQGLKPETFHLIVASNVLHNAKDLGQALTKIRRILVPGGILILRELTRHNPLFDLFFGPLVPELSDIEKRQGEVFPSLEIWDQFLTQSGWPNWDFFPKSDSPAFAIGEHIIVAHNGGPRTKPRTSSPYEQNYAISDIESTAPLHTSQEPYLFSAPTEKKIFSSSLVSREPHLYYTEWQDVESTYLTEAIACVIRVDDQPSSLTHLWDTSPKKISELKTVQPKDGVVVLDLTAEGEPTNSSYWSVIDIIRFCADRSLKLCLVTQDAMIVTPWDKGINAAWQGLKGLIRVARNEYTGFNLRWIDLVSCETLGQMVPNLLTMPNSEDIMALRRGRIFVPRLNHLPKKAYVSTIPSVSHGRHLIIGALSPFARTIATWLVQNGACHLWLIARRDPSEEEQKTIEKLESLGAQIRLWTTVDVTEKTDLERVFEEACADSMPINTIFHLPGYLEDMPLARLQEESLERVLAPKVKGARIIMDWLPRLNPHYVGFSSSASASLGPQGQATHAIANGILEGLAEKSRYAGWPVQALGWGYWDEGRTDRSTLTESIAHHGMLGLSPDESCTLLGTSMGLQEPILLPMKINWPALIATTKESLSRGFLELYGRNNEQLPEILTPEPEKTFSKQESFDSWLKTRLSELTKIPEDILDPEANLIALGVDSLMILDITKRIKTTFGLDVPANILFQHNTLRKLSAYIAPKLEGSDKAISAEADSMIEPEKTFSKQESFDSWLKTRLSELTKIPEDMLDPEANLIALGVDSLMILDITKRIKTTFGLDVPANILFQRNTLRKLSAYITPKLEEKGDFVNQSIQHTIEV